MSNIFESMQMDTNDTLNSLENAQKVLSGAQEAVSDAQEAVDTANAVAANANAAVVDANNTNEQVTAYAVAKVQDVLNDLTTASATTSTDDNGSASTNPPLQPSSDDNGSASTTPPSPPPQSSQPVSEPAPVSVSEPAPVSNDLLGSGPENNPAFHDDVHNMMGNEVIHGNNVVPSVDNVDTVEQEQLSEILSTVRDTNNHVEQIHTSVNNLTNTVNDVLTNEGLHPNNKVDNFDNTEIEGFTNEIVEGFSRFKMSSVLLAISLLVLMVLGYLYVSNNVFSSDSSIELTDTPFMDMDFD